MRASKNNLKLFLLLLKLDNLARSSSKKDRGLGGLVLSMMMLGMVVLAEAGTKTMETAVFYEAQDYLMECLGVE